MGNVFTTSHQSTRSSGLLATTSVPSTSLQGGTTPPPLRTEPRNDEGQEALLQKVIQGLKGLRNHVPELYRQLRTGTAFDPDVLQSILDTVDKASGGLPWPVTLVVKAAFLLADNALTVHDSAAVQDSLASAVQDSLASTFAEVKRKLQSVEELGLRDEDEDQMKNISAKLIAASAVFEHIVEKRSSTRTCGTCFHAFDCAQCNAKKLSDVSANLEICLGSIRDILTRLIADNMERPCNDALEGPCNDALELPSHLVRMEEPVSKVMGFLRDSGGRTRVVGLHGQGGIGKSTLMSCVEAILRSGSHYVDGRRTTHKIASVKVGLQPPALTDLQESLYSQLSHGSNDSISSEAQGRVKLRKLIESLKGRGKMICIFLDDVWKIEHLKELLPQPDDLADALPHGSYLFISSRSASVVAKLASMCFKTEREEKEGYLGYQLPMLRKQDAENIFLRMASREDEKKPLQSDDELVQAIVPLCDGLPLALTVYGSIFKDGERRKPNVWKRVVEQLERAEDPRFADDRVFEKLKACVNFQDERLQYAFIDVAVMCRSDALGWATPFTLCDANEALALVMEQEDLEYLVDQSLVTRRGDEVVIHDLLLKVAKQMAKERNLWFVTRNTSVDEIAELLRPHPQVVASIRAFDETVWCTHAKESYPSSAQIQDVRYLIMNRYNWQEVSPLDQRREFQLMIANHCYKLRMLVVDTLVTEQLTKQLSWIADLRQLRWLSVKDDSLSGISKVR